MTVNFLEKLNKPFFASAPMYGVSDEAFRRMLLKYAKPDLVWTEMVSADGLVYMAEKGGMNYRGAKVLMKIMQFVNEERPIVCQLFGSNPENFYKASLILNKIGVDVIDINTGCPEKSVMSQGAGADLIRKPELVKEIIEAVKKGAEDKPVFLKTRIGYEKEEVDTWIKFLLEQDLAGLTVHVRTVKDGFGETTHWETMKRAVELKNKINPKTLIIGNGGIKDLAEAKEKAKEFDLDGVMIGRALIGNPWFFSNKHKGDEEEKLQAILEHSKIFEETFTGVKKFDDIKKHLVEYANGFAGAKELRIKLMKVEGFKDVQTAVDEFKVKG